VYVANLNPLLAGWRKKLKESSRLLETRLQFEDLVCNDGVVRYGDIEASKIIFCDGTAATENPWFRLLPFAPNKGEALIAEIPGLPTDHLFKKSMALVPQEGLGKDIFWIGSNYSWSFDNAEPTKEFRTSTEKSLNEWLKIPFKILEHRCGIRPATLERRPFVGMHPQYSFAGIVNGLGAKGVSLAPYFAKQMADYLTKDKPIHPEADVKRFMKVLSRTA
jgi:glycine/D-amino acid oxidase-like deaminating enzyme